jgi:hypothetical protein
MDIMVIGSSSASEESSTATVVDTSNSQPADGGENPNIGSARSGTQLGLQPNAVYSRIGNAVP